MFYANKNTKGFSTILLFALVSSLTVSLAALLSATSLVSKQTIIQEQHKIQIAFNAAEMGVDYMTAYLTVNRDRERISDGEMMTYNLPDGGAFRAQIHYVGNKDLIRIISVGSAQDGDSPRTIHQLVQYNEKVTIPGTGPATGYGRVSGGWAIFNEEEK